MAEIIERYTSYLWQEESGKPYYRIQTNDYRIAQKMKKKMTGNNPQKVRQVLYGINVPVWVFQILYSSPRVAKKSFGRITTQKVQKHPDKTLRVSYTVPPRHLQSKVKALKPLKGVDNVS
tara:strand:- start:41 stop:400 length:360 start_codon:yes stop_codon:yes gene_type:complete